MINELIIKTRVTLKYKEGSYSYSNIKPTATNAELYELAGAFNSVQEKEPEEIYAQVTTKLTEF